jgi:hypothetical protein
VGDEKLNGHDCFRIDIEPTDAVPCVLSDPIIADGMIPQEESILTKFEAHALVDKTTGWVVELESDVSFKSVSKSDVREKNSKQLFIMNEFKNISGAEYDTLASQFNKLDFIQSYWTGGSWPGRRNLIIDSDTGEKMLADFRKKWPKSRFDPFIARLQKLFETQRESVKINPIFEKPFAEFLDKPAPAFSGTYLDGRPFSTDSLRGKPAVMIFMFIGNDNVGYRAAAIESFAKKWQKKGVQVVGVTYQFDRRNVVETFVKENHITFPIVLPEYVVGNPLDKRPDALYQIGSLITIVALDSEGKIQHYRAELYPTELEPLLKKLL